MIPTLNKLLGEDVTEVVSRTTIIGVIVGVLSVILAEEKTTLKIKLVNTVYAVIFAIFAGLIMEHLKLDGEVSSYLEWAVVGFTSYNQKAIRILSNMLFIAVTNKPFETGKKIKELLRK